MKISPRLFNIMAFLVFFLVILCAVSATAFDTVEECIKGLSSDVRIGVNDRIDDRHPVVIVNVTSASHIQSSVFCGETFGFQIIPMNGGHSFEGLSTTNSILLNLDMYHNATIDVSNSSNPTVTVQSGIRLARLYGLLVQALYSNESTSDSAGPFYVLAGGTCPTVGVTGHVVCGGYGMFGRMIGLTSDQIQSFEIVNASGSLITVSSTEYPEVFWALRGSCSSSFGVISTITFKLHQLTHGPNITIFNPHNNGSQTVISGSANIVQAALWYQSYATYTAPNELTMNINFKANNQIILEGVFLGPKSLALALVGQAMADGLTGIFNATQISDLFVEGSYLDAIRWWTNDESLTTAEDLVEVTALDALGSKSRSSRRKAKSALIRGIIPAEGIQKIADLYTAKSINQMEWKAYGGVDRIDVTPYSTSQSPLLRGHLFEAHYSMSWTAGENDTEAYKHMKDQELVANMSKVQTTLEAYSAFSNQSYVGYIDLNSTSNASLLGEVYFGSENAATLRKLRGEIDPLGVLTSETSEYLYPAMTNNSSSSSGDSGTADGEESDSSAASKGTVRYLGDKGLGNTKLTCKRHFGIIVCDDPV